MPKKDLSRQRRPRGGNSRIGLNRKIKWCNWLDEPVVAKFGIDDWHQILPNVNSDQELKNLLSNYILAYVAYKSMANAPFAFAILINRPWKNNIVEIHGGCWRGSAWDCYEALVSMIDLQFLQGKNIRSSCSIVNKRSFRFLHSMGFVNHYTSKYYHYFWLPYNRYINTAIYKRIHG